MEIRGFVCTSKVLCMGALTDALTVFPWGSVRAHVTRKGFIFGRCRLCMYVCMYVCMYACMYGWMDGCMDVCMYVSV